MNKNGKTSNVSVKEERLYTVPEVAELLDISESRAYYLVGSVLPFILRNRCRMVKESDLEAFIESPAAEALKPKKKIHRQGSQAEKQPAMLTEHLDQVTMPGIPPMRPAPPTPIEKRLESVARFPNNSPRLIAYPPDVPAKKVEVINHEPPAHRIDRTEVVVVTNYPVIVDWLHAHQINARRIERPSGIDIQDKHVIAHALPFYLTIQAKSVSWVEVRGVNLATATVEDLDHAGAQIVTLDISTTANPEPLWLDGVPF